MVRKIVEAVPEDLLLSYLEKYRTQAIHLGASDAKIIRSEDVLIDERVQAKCSLPKCQNYGTNANCPPYALRPDQTREILKKYRYGILYTFQAISEGFVGSYDVLSNREEVARQRSLIFEICSKLEAAAFYDGYYLALGFAGGSCRSVFCKDIECQVLQPGKGCRFPLKARPSMEAVGIDVYKMCVRAGWDIYPCGASLSPEQVPFGRRVGLVIID